MFPTKNLVHLMAKFFSNESVKIVSRIHVELTMTSGPNFPAVKYAKTKMPL